MPSQFQQQSRLRKLIYSILILALFTATLFFRRADTYGVEARANDLGLREHTLGDVELTGSAIRLMLTGSRGLAVCGLWWSAQEKQKRHEWNQLEMLVRSVTKLQPHFITPWLFQSWNLAYNVSVESDRVRDKYFYITRGIELLSEGERLNRNHPDLRFTLGFYNQQKIGMSDEADALRCLYQMSCIRPEERDPNALRTAGEGGRVVVDMAKFEAFCQANPMLVRRLRLYLKCESPEDIVDFLAANQKVPGRYEEGAQATGGLSQVRSNLKPLEQQFPMLPPESRLTREDPHPDQDVFGPELDNFGVARAWFNYALEPLPPPDSKPVAVPVNPDPSRYRMPRAMASHIFRGYSARGQSFVAEWLQKEGWFDSEGWHITGWFPEDKFQGGGRSRDAVVGSGLDWFLRAWSKAFEMWQDHGSKNGLYMTPVQLKNLEDRAEHYRTTLKLVPYTMPNELPADQRTPELMDSKAAHDQLYWYDRNREMTNFAHFYFNSQVEMSPAAIRARKLIFQADQLRLAGQRHQAMQQYAEALPMWRDLMLAHREFRRDASVQEDSYEIELKYQELVRRLRGNQLKELLVMQDYLTQAAVRPPLATVWLPSVQVIRLAPLGLRGFFDVQAEDGQMLVPEETKARVRARHGLVPTQGTASAAPPAGGPPSTGPEPRPAGK